MQQKPQGFDRGLGKHAVGNRLVNSPFLTALHPASKAPWSLSQTDSLAPSVGSPANGWLGEAHRVATWDALEPHLSIVGDAVHTPLRPQRAEISICSSILHY